MATLRCFAGDRDTGTLIPAQLSITPVMPSLEGPRDTYEIVVGPSYEGHVLKGKISLLGWQYGHTDIRYLAIMCSEVNALKQCQSAPGASRGSFYWSLGWADVLLVNAGSQKEPEGVDVLVYAYDMDDRSSPNAGWRGDRCRCFNLHSNKTDVQRFGEALVAELKAAHIKRQELGIATLDDMDWIYAESEDRF